MMLNGPRLLPKGSIKPKQLVVLFHGYGANGADLIGLAPALARVLPDAAFFSPNAPDPVPGYPMGRQWFGLTRLSPDELATGARMAAPGLMSGLKAELDRYGLDASQLALLGFSQGAMMALHVGLRMSPQIAAIVGFSGALPDPVRLENEMAARPPVFLAHGAMDEVVPPEASMHAHSVLGSLGCVCRLHISPDLPHAIDPEALDQAGDFLKAAFAGEFAALSSPDALR